MNAKLIPLLTFVAFLSACSDGNNNSNNGASAPTYSVNPETIDVSQAGYCDITQTDLCLFPFPNDFFTREDAAAPTGKRVNFDPRSMPVNSDGIGIDPSEFNRSDGFSIGGTILTRAEGVDLAVTGAASIVDMGASLDAGAPIQLIQADTGERQLIWAELDQNPEPGEPQVLMIQVGKALQNGTRYIVVLQKLMDAEGNAIEPAGAFKIYQEAIPSDVTWSSISLQPS